MKLSYCTNCQLNVVANAQGLCPGCRNPIPTDSQDEVVAAANRARDESVDVGKLTPPERATIPCPNCGQPLQKLAVLCIHCGYHLKFKRFIATQVSSADSMPVESGTLDFARDSSQSDVVKSISPADSNPYTAPTTQPEQSAVDLPLPLANLAKLTEQLKWETSTSSLLALALLTFCCTLLALPAIPVCLFRIGQWHYLNAKYAALRQPNSLTETGRLAFDFQEARIRLYLALLICFCAPLAAGMLFQIISQSSSLRP